MRGVWVVVFAGCGFTAPLAGNTPAPDDADDPTGDVNRDGAPGSEEPITIAGCPGPPLAGALRLCVEFEDTSLATTAVDASGLNNNVAVGQVTTMMRGVEQAAKLGVNSTLHIAENQSLDPPALAIEAWVSLEVLPTGTGRAFVIDNQSQYGFSILAGGTVLCTFGSGQNITSTLTVPLNTWTHVACSYDGTALRNYVNGDLSACATGGTAVPSGGSAGTAIGADLDIGPAFSQKLRGGIDDVRLYNRGLTGVEVCGLAGRSGCDAVCD